MGHPFAMIPRFWAEPSSGLKPRDLHVAIMLFSYGGGPNRAAYPALQTIADKTGLSVSTVRRSIKRMIDLGHIAAEQIPGAPTKYRVLNFETGVVTMRDQGVCSPARPPSRPVVDIRVKQTVEKPTEEPVNHENVARIKAMIRQTLAGGGHG